MNPYTKQIIRVFKEAQNARNAIPMKAYMKNKFEYLGIKTPERRELSKPFLTKASLPAVDDLWQIIMELWEQPEREYQYFAQGLCAKYLHYVKKDWIDHYKSLIIHKSWWDTVDFIAATLVGSYFKKFPEMIPSVTGRWMQSGNIWLQRSCILFQLKYKKDTDTTLLTSFIKPLASSKEFFIAKAIGWALREYSKTNPDWVLNFVENNTLQPLSKREAIRRVI
jgi:3-methyladenine DNA glycosylase AlkD